MRYKRLSPDIKADLLDMIERYKAYGYSQAAICRQWGICAKTLHRVKGCRLLRKPSKRQALNAITVAEKAVVKAYALAHTELNHREMAYRMIDENKAFMSPSSVYRILKENKLIATRESNTDSERWNRHEQPDSPNVVWQTDLMILRYKGRDYFLLSYIDVYSRFIVYHELLTSMTGDTLKEATYRALGESGCKPLSIQSDNGSGYTSREYASCFGDSSMKHHRIHPYCPNENAEIERYHRTVRELLDPYEAENFDHLGWLVKDRINYYNKVRYHSAIGFVTPHDKYTGRAEKIIKSREIKLAKARKKRLQENRLHITTKAA